MDDGFNSQWVRAAVNLERTSPKVMTFAFRPLRREIRDFPDAADYDVGFRRTLGIRVAAPGGAAVRKVQVLTRSAPVRTCLHVQLDAGRRTRGRTLSVCGYNAVIRGAVPKAGADAQWKRLTLSRKRICELEVEHMVPAHRWCYDDGLVTFATEKETFTISLTALEAEGPVWFAEQGVYIRRADDPTSFAEYRARIKGCRTIAEQVCDRPEQGLGGARRGQPRPHPIPYCFGCKHARQKFWLEPDGDLLLIAWIVTRQQAADTPRWKNAGDARFFFGLERWSVNGRFNDPWPVMAYNLHLKRDAVLLEQKCFAVPLGPSILDGEPASDETMVALVRFRFENTGDAPAVAELPVSYSSRSARSQNRRLELAAGARRQTDNLIPLGPRDPLTVEGGRITSQHEGEKVIRCTFETPMETVESGEAVRFRRRLAPGERCELLLKIPYVAVETAEELAALKGLRFDRCYGEMKRYWRREGGRGARIRTPEPHLNAAYAGHLPIVMITDLGLPDGSGLVNTSVGTATYGNYTNESCMILEELDQRGLADEVRRRLGVWVRYQGTAELRGNFTDQRGVLFGAGGLEAGSSYNQHHGWALWYLGRHYLLTGDDDWFGGVADSVIAAADWIFRQRKATLAKLPHSRGWEKGFLPAGALEDVDDYFYWLSTNALTWRGADTAAAALEAYGHGEAKRVRREADAFRRDLVRGFETARRHSPLIRLRSGRWIPHYPSRIYRRGRDYGWIREVLEGSVYLLLSGLYDPESRQGGWILDDYLDTRYMNPPFGYPLQDPQTEWFDCGGLSVQPNLLAGLTPHLDRDEPEIYLWMFFNAWAACYREEVN
ncbi:MAG TPA: hypothetical protein VMZ50_02510, partial [Phycisphaerae bacterium]|nr:hypothetical protein [Phycisphaerae bacterium]